MLIFVERSFITKCYFTMKCIDIFFNILFFIFPHFFNILNLNTFRLITESLSQIYVELIDMSTFHFLF